MYVRGSEARDYCVLTQMVIKIPAVAGKIALSESHYKNQFLFLEYNLIYGCYCDIIYD